MATIVDVTRAMKLVQNAEQGMRIVNGALAEVVAAQKTGNIPTDLANSKRDLEALKKRIGSSGKADFLTVWGEAKSTVTRAYVNVAGAVGEFQAREAVSLATELTQAAKEAPALIGETLGSVAAGVGNTAGSLLGGLFAGLGPIVVVVIGFIVYSKYAKK